MKPASRISRLAVAVVAHLHEREMLRAENKVLEVIAGRPIVTAGEVAELGVLNRARLSRLERRLPNKAAIAARAVVKHMPATVRRPISLATRLLVNTIGRKARLADGQDPEVAPSPSPGLSMHSAAVPFGPAFPPPRLEKPIAVIVHMFYPELALEMRGYLENLPSAANVYLSTDTEAKSGQILKAFADWRKGAVEVRLAPNRGRDVAPKLITFRDVYRRYAYVLHLHGKRSPHESYLKLWRYFVYETLVGSPAVVAGILSAFDHSPELGMVAPQHYYPIKNAICWGENLSFGQDLARRLGFELDPDAPLDFPSGSMFWARSAALQPLLDLDLAIDDFPLESAQEDATLAHAIERLYFHACERAGLKWMQVLRPELAHEQSRDPTQIMGLSDLQAYLRDGTVALLDRRVIGQ